MVGVGLIKSFDFKTVLINNAIQFFVSLDFVASFSKSISVQFDDECCVDFLSAFLSEIEKNRMSP